jgi:acyl carrier protein
MVSASEVRKELKKFILNEILRDTTYRIKPDEPLISGGLIDSFSVVQIAVFVEQEFGIVIPDADLTVENMDTLDKITQLILELRKK